MQKRDEVQMAYQKGFRDGQKGKRCVCGRIKGKHEHTTIQRYLLVEESPDKVYRSENYMHGYDDEDDHIYEFIDDCKRDNPTYSYSLRLLRSEDLIK